MKIENLNDQLMVMAAHRYCLGRMTYIVSACCEWLVDTWPQFEPNTKYVILRDTIEAIMSDRAGMVYDADEWAKIVRFGYAQLRPEEREDLLRSVSPQVDREAVLKTLGIVVVE
jgi:hypothetical protein